MGARGRATRPRTQLGCCVGRDAHRVPHARCETTSGRAAQGARRCARRRSERDRMLIHLSLQTGIRIASALALDVEDVDLAHGELALRSTKGDRPTTALLPAATTKMLRGFL